MDEKLTPLGIALAKIPVDIGIGKMLLMGCVFQQLQPVLTLAAALSVQTPFTNRAFRDAECEVPEIFFIYCMYLKLFIRITACLTISRVGSWRSDYFAKCIQRMVGVEAGS